MRVVIIARDGENVTIDDVHVLLVADIEEDGKEHVHVACAHEEDESLVFATESEDIKQLLADRPGLEFVEEERSDNVGSNQDEN